MYDSFRQIVWRHLFSDAALCFCCILNGGFVYVDFITSKCDYHTRNASCIKGLHVMLNGRKQNKVICLLLSSVTHSKVIQGAALPERLRINKHIPSYLFRAGSHAAHHIRELSSNGEVRGSFLCSHPQETQNSTQPSSRRSASHSPAVMRLRVGANQRRVGRFEENAQRCRSLLLGFGIIQIREITLFITPPKGRLLGEEPDVSTLVRHVRLDLFCLSWLLLL